MITIKFVANLIRLRETFCQETKINAFFSKKKKKTREFLKKLNN